MKHLGDITAISGYTVPTVDTVIGGSPCQDLSIAGKREGLAGAKSSLFMEQIRIIKEMREADVHRGRTGVLIRPRIMVWENVPGVFSSNKGEDFRAVLEEVIKIAEPEAPDVPLPPKGRWPMADAWYGDDWSVAYRVFDAQFWGVPQRRRRIALVADFGGHAAPEILFIRKGVCGDIEQSATARESIAAGTGRNIEKAIALRMRAGCAGGGKGPLVQIEKSGTLGCNNDQTIIENVSKRNAPMVFENHGQDSRFNGPVAVSQTVSATFGMGGNDTPLVVEPIVMATGQGGAEITIGKSPTLTSNHEQPIIANTLRASGRDPHREDMATYPITGGIARRLTPLECERLQGYPDGWTDIGPWTDSKRKLHKKSSDRVRYKALGNSIALPPWAWILKRLCACYERPATMASLFDGIGGFPFLWERLNGPGSCLWASEIEEFPMAVTKYRFGGPN